MRECFTFQNCNKAMALSSLSVAIHTRQSQISKWTTQYFTKKTHSQQSK